MIKITDFPKLESPFMRELNKKGEYVVTDKIAEGMEWVFEDASVLATEKIHGTCCAVAIENGVAVSLWNRANRINFIGGTPSKALTEGVNNALAKERFAMEDGVQWGELIGPRIQKNDYALQEHEWLPFETYVKKHLAYKSWHKYPKTYENIRDWFFKSIEEGGIFSLLMRRKGITQKPEGIVFHHPDGRMAKLRLDMFQEALDKGIKPHKSGSDNI